MSETLTITDEKRLGIVLKGQDNYLSRVFTLPSTAKI